MQSITPTVDVRTSALPAKPPAREAASKNHINNLTGVRGVGSIWILLYHFFNQFSIPGLAFGYVGVDMFFVLSGFILSMVYLPGLTERFNWPWYTKFLSRRFAKIYPMHLLTFAGMGLLVLAGHFTRYQFTASNLKNTPWTAACNLLMVHAWGLTKAPSWNGNSWSISAEWLAYSLLFAPIAFLFRRIRLVWVVLITALLWFCLMVVCARISPHGLGYMTTNGALRILPEFTGGYLLYRFIFGRCSKWGDVWTVGAIALFVSVGYLHLTFLLLPAIMVLLAGLYFDGRLTQFIFGNRPMVRLGEASYSVYLVHGIVRNVTRVAFGTFGIDFRYSWVPSAVGCICAVAVGLLAFHLFEEPARLWLLRILSARTSQRTSSSPSAVPA